MNTPASLRTTIKSCLKCPRLVRHQNALKKINPDYHCAPVVPWGVARPRLLIVGLAPIAGAGRTGKGFVGDASGAFLFSSLYEHGFSSSSEAEGRAYGELSLRISLNVCRPRIVPWASRSDSANAFCGRNLRNFSRVRKPGLGLFFVWARTHMMVLSE